MYSDKGGWSVRWREHGQRRSRWFQDKSDANRFELERKLGVVEPTVAITSLTFGEWADKWMETYCRQEKAESQWRADEISIRLHLKPVLGGIKLPHLRRSHLLDLKDQIRVKFANTKSRKLSPKSVNLILALAKKIMATAVERELIAANPFNGIRMVRLPPQRFQFWTTSERDRFLAYAWESDQEFARLVLIACHTGLRLGELAALTRADLDFERRKIRVSKTWDVNLAKVMPMTKGKTDDDMPMNTAVYDALGPKRFVQADAFIFERALFWNARKRLGRLAKRAGVRPIRFHDLRHTFASHLAMAGVDLMQIKDLCRHKSYQMTLRYAHLHPDHRLGATEVLCSEVGQKVARSKLEIVKSGGPRGT